MFGIGSPELGDPGDRPEQWQIVWLRQPVDLGLWKSAVNLLLGGEAVDDVPQ